MYKASSGAIEYINIFEVSNINSTLKSHFEKVGETMAKEWTQKAGSRGAAVLSAYK